MDLEANRSGECSEVDTSGDHNATEESKPGPIHRRKYLQLMGAGAALIGGTGLGASADITDDESVPAQSDNWVLAFEDTFDGGSLDTSTWGIGWGWGTSTNYSPSKASAGNVEVSDGVLKLTATQGDGSPEYWIGAVNTKDRMTIGPGSYLEARIKCMNLPGSNNAFWSKPNTEEWPPEIDFVEVPTDRIDESMHNIHYSASGEVGDGSTHETHQNGRYNPDGEDMQDRFFVYGCEWQEDVIAHYVDGNLVGRTTDNTVTDAVRAGAPFYLMLNVLVGGWPPGDVPDDWSGYDTEMHVDWVRVWDYDADGDSETEDPDEETRFLWFRSRNGDTATFEFEASPGEIELQDGPDADYWVADAATRAGGTVDRTESLPGFWFDGDITDLTYDGPLEMFIDGESVDPDQFVTDDVETPLPNTITFDGASYSGTASYSVTVSGELEGTETVTEEDEVSDSSASGIVGDGRDIYRFDGEVTHLALDGDADIFINDVLVSLVIVKRAETSSRRVTYIVETSADVLGADVPDATEDPGDKIGDGRVLGRVEDDPDAYWLMDGNFLGASSFNGDIVVVLDGKEIEE